jgi:hypothetical protein
VKKLLFFLSILVIGGIFLLSLSGCSQPPTVTNQSIPALNKPELPSVDSLPNRPLETAYFALG